MHCSHLWPELASIRAIHMSSRPCMIRLSEMGIRCIFCCCCAPSCKMSLPLLLPGLGLYGCNTFLFTFLDNFLGDVMFAGPMEPVQCPVFSHVMCMCMFCAFHICLLFIKVGTLIRQQHFLHPTSSHHPVLQRASIHTTSFPSHTTPYSKRGSRRAGGVRSYSHCSTIVQRKSAFCLDLRPRKPSSFEYIREFATNTVAMKTFQYDHRLENRNNCRIIATVTTINWTLNRPRHEHAKRSTPRQISVLTKSSCHVVGQSH